MCPILPDLAAATPRLWRIEFDVLGPILTIVLSVGLGFGLALVPGGTRRWGGVIRTFAVAAALSVVVLHLVPHALHRVGIVGLVLAVASFLMTPLIEAGVARVVRREQGGVDIRLEAAYAALLVHRIGDGAAMAVGQRHGVGLLLALGAHAVPVVAFVVMAFARSRGLQHGLWRAVGLALASGVGVVGIEAVPNLTVGAMGGYVDAIVAGTLLHVVAHELRTDPPDGAGIRLLDFLAAAIGVGTCLLPELFTREGHEHVAHAHGDAGTAQLAHTALELALEMAPVLLVGLLVAALLQSLGKGFPNVSERGSLWGAVRGSVLAAPLPLCSCSVASIARSLGARRAAPALVVGFLVATPELGLDTLLVTAQLLGWPLAVLRLGGALLMAVAAGLFTAALMGNRQGNAPPQEAAEAAQTDALAHVTPTGSLGKRYFHALDELVIHVGGWLALGVALAVYLDQLVPEQTFAAMGSAPAELGVLTLVALPAYVCAPAATPIAAVLIAKGVGVGPVLGGVLLGSTLNFAGARVVRELYGTWAAVGVVGTAALIAWGLGLGVNEVLPSTAPAGHGEAHEAHGILAWASLVILLLLGAKTGWHVGIRAWLANLFEPRHEGQGHVHVHDHCATHAHPHAHDWDQWHAHEPHHEGQARAHEPRHEGPEAHSHEPHSHEPLHQGHEAHPHEGPEAQDAYDGSPVNPGTGAK